jgi:hypothetical protein
MRQAPRLRFNRWGGAALPLVCGRGAERRGHEAARCRAPPRTEPHSDEQLLARLHVQERLQKVEDIREQDSDAVNLPPTAAPAVLSEGASLRTHRMFRYWKAQPPARSDSITRRLRRGLIGLARRRASGVNRSIPMGFETRSRHASVSIEPTRLASKAAIFASCCSM